MTQYKEEKQRYYFLRTEEGIGENGKKAWKAIVIDSEHPDIGGSSGVESLRRSVISGFFNKSSDAGNVIRRGGMYSYDLEKLRAFAEKLEKEGLDRSLGAVKRAITVVLSKQTPAAEITGDRGALAAVPKVLAHKF